LTVKIIVVRVVKDKKRKVKAKEIYKKRNVLRVSVPITCKLHTRATSAI
jgi:hypothetical protein